MIVCSCYAVRDQDVDRLVKQGCRTVAALGRACGAGTDCGTCVPDLRARLAEVRSAPRDEVPACMAMAAAAK